jgi:hypothetical protein
MTKVITKSKSSLKNSMKNKVISHIGLQDVSFRIQSTLPQADGIRLNGYWVGKKSKKLVTIMLDSIFIDEHDYLKWQVCENGALA